jgi:hypothetical protein|tara:strand:+ start:219 stop:548 length:330 start_codon:yes stop_codon:yes gene_type:complete
MLIKKYKFLILIGIASLFFSSCSTVKKAFDPQRKNSSEEFLVEKKSPLSMPPDFDELPVPQNNNKDNKDQSKDIELLITENDKSKNPSTELESSDKDFLKLILDKIKKN